MKNHRLLNLLLVCVSLAVLPLSALAANAPAQADLNTPIAAAAANPDAGKVGETPGPANDYKLRAGDHVTVTLMGDPRSNHDYDIGADGTLASMFLNKPLALSGLTIDQAVEVLVKAYKDSGVFTSPQVAIQVNTHADRKINVFGAVNKPHQVIVPSGETATLVSVIAACNGPAAIAAAEVEITRKLADGKTMVFRADLKAAIKDATKDIPIQDGDAVYLPQDVFGGKWQ